MARQKIPSGISNIRTIIDAGVGRGMMAMDNSIQREYDAGNISAEEAYMKSSDKGRFMPMLKAEKEQMEQWMAAQLAQEQMPQE